jgi:uncharacterized membrane protein
VDAVDAVSDVASTVDGTGASADTDTDTDTMTETGMDPVRVATSPERAGETWADPLSREQNPWWSVAGITILFWAFALYDTVDSHPWLIVVVIVLGIWGLGTIAASLITVPVDRRFAEALAWATVGLALAALFVWSYLQVLGAPGYGTDEVAFDQYAAQLLVHGFNPYAHSLAQSFSLFHVSPNGFTFGLDGQPVTRLSYPALSFLLYAPIVAFGATAQVAIVVNVLAWGVGMALFFALLPRRIRPMAIVVTSFSVYIGYAVGGVTDALFVPLLIGAVYRWDEFPRQRGWVAWRGPVLLGLAMAVKQTPWLVLPFLVAGVGLEARRSPGAEERPWWWVPGRYLAIALGAFLVPNLPFMVADAHAWWNGILTPVVGHAVPAGQGYVGLSLFLGVGGGSLVAYTAALAVILLWLIATFVLTYPSLKRVAVLIPAVVLFFSARSFGSYLVTLLPAALVAAYTVDRVPSRPPEPAPTWRDRWVWVVPTGVVVSVLALLSVVFFPPPLDLVVTSVRTTGQLATVVQLGVQVTNTSGSAVRPAFTIETGGAITAFWRFTGPQTLRAHTSSHYELYAPNFFAQPPVSGGFQVVAFTSSPATVSRSSAYLPTNLHVSLIPDAVNAPVRVGQTVTLRAEVLNNLDQLVNTTGMPVYLGQIIYNQKGLIYSEAIINNSQVGQTPVTAFTTDGVATFVVRGTVATPDPVYFEANLINANQFYPYGYSEIVPIRFVK